MRRQQIFLRVLIEQNFDFSSLLADPETVRFSGEEALRELAMIDASWRMQTFENVHHATINGMWVQLKENEPVSRDTVDAGAPLLAVVVIALGAPVEAVDAVKSLLEQKPPVEILVVNTGGGGMAALLARHGIDVPVIEREERLYAGAARNIGIGPRGRLMSPFSHRIAGRQKAGPEDGSPLTARVLRRSAAPCKTAIPTICSPGPLILRCGRGAYRARAADFPMAPLMTGACSNSGDIFARICALARTANSTGACGNRRNGKGRSSARLPLR